MRNALNQNKREIAKKIHSNEGDYVLSLKENQPTLYEYAQTYFEDAQEHPQEYPEMTCHEICAFCPKASAGAKASFHKA